MSWRAIMKSEPHTQYSQNTQNPPKKTSSEDIEDIEHKNKNVKAIGYGCAGCGNRIYQAVKVWDISELPASSPWTHEHKPITHWKCKGCGAVFSIIGGTRGPVLIQ